MIRARRAALLVLACVVVGLAGSGSATTVVAVLATLVGINLTAIGGWKLLVRPPGRPRTAGHPVPALAACWLAVLILPSHNFIKRANADAVSQAGIEPLIELGYFAAIGVLALLTIHRLEPTLDRARPPIIVFLLPVWATASFAWSGTSAYALARGGEMVVIATLAWATTALGRSSPGALEDLVDHILRWFVRSIGALVVLGVVFGPILVPASAENLERFTWIGAHPNGSGLLMAAAVVVLVATTPDVLGLTRTGRGLFVAVLAAALIENQSRTALVALAGGLVLAIALRGGTRLVWHRRRTPVVVVAVLAIAIVGRGTLGDFFLRGRDADSLLTGNGRLGLWTIGFDALDTGFDWICGLGYGAARTVFVAERSWATTAHNSVLSILVSLGVVGVGIFALLVWTTARDLHRSRSTDRSTHEVGLVAFAGVVLLGALASDIAAEPNVGLAGLLLTAAVATARRSSGVSDLGDRLRDSVEIG